MILIKPIAPTWQDMVARAHGTPLRRIMLWRKNGARSGKGRGRSSGSVSVGGPAVGRELAQHTLPRMGSRREPVLVVMLAPGGPLAFHVTAS